MGFAELQGDYESFLRGERYKLTDRISTAIDDFQHAVTLDSGGAAPNTNPRVAISMAELRSEGLSERLRYDPLRHMRALETACNNIAKADRPGFDKEGATLKIALSGPVGAAPVSPRQLTASCLRQLVCVEGVATKVSAIKPKVVKSVHYCPATKKMLTREYVDATDPNLGLEALDKEGRELQNSLATDEQESANRFINITTSVYPTKDDLGNPLETEFGNCIFKDHQTITLQEMPEKAPMGQLPRSVELILDHDLVDKVKPGDRVMIVGVYRALATASQGQQTSAGFFRTVVLVNNVQILGRDVGQLDFTPMDIRNIRSLAQQPNILNLLGRSISPSIHGHTIIKKALALQLLSGVEKNLENGTHLRGDINILMVGDPSTAKSQLLRSAMTIAPLAISTTGKGSSGVGLTAAVTSDPDTRERRLEAGAMVLADRGLVCVDEFDKMGENDRVAIHEAMEQQTVTIAKAGIHATLNARCSVLAAANPVYGQYDRRRRIQENIGLPDSLLSRFDLLFVVLDQMDPELDRRIATHVLRGHRTRTEDHEHDHDSDSEDEGDSPVQSIWQRGYHHAMEDDDDEDDDSDDPHARDVLQLNFLRKYLHFAKTRIVPVLTGPARDIIASRYAEMRARQDERTIPVTARSLETIIRLATAHAKARLSDEVLEQDCQAAMDILSFALYHEQASEGSKGASYKATEKRAIVSDDGAENNSDVDDDDSIHAPAPTKRSKHGDGDDMKLQQMIWDAFDDYDDELTDETLAEVTNNADPAAVQAVLRVLQQDGRIDYIDGVVRKV